jgi:hypothetical protein
MKKIEGITLTFSNLNEKDAIQLLNCRTVQTKLPGLVSPTPRTRKELAELAHPKRKKEWKPYLDGKDPLIRKRGQPPQMTSPVAYQLSKEMHKKVKAGRAWLPRESPPKKRGRPPKVIKYEEWPRCKTKGCSRPSRSKGLCQKHYQRARYHEKNPKAKTRKVKK